MANISHTAKFIPFTLKLIQNRHFSAGTKIAEPLYV